MFWKERTPEIRQLRAEFLLVDIWRSQAPGWIKVRIERDLVERSAGNLNEFAPEVRAEQNFSDGSGLERSCCRRPRLTRDAGYP